MISWFIQNCRCTSAAKQSEGVFQLTVDPFGGISFVVGVRNMYKRGF